MSTLSLGTVFLTLSTVAALAADSDPGYGARPSSGDAAAQGLARKGQGASAYFRPTMRYYGKGFTVAYRYVSWSDKTKAPTSTAFESEQFHLPATSARAVAGVAPRVTYYYDRGVKPSAQPKAQPALKPVPPIVEKSR